MNLFAACLRMLAMPDWTDCLIGIGGNEGNRAAAFSGFWLMLTGDADFRRPRAAGIYRTTPMQTSGHIATAPVFWNSAVAAQTRLGAHALLERLKHWESELGRRPAERWGSRAIDLDILLFGDARVFDAVLTVPHPGLVYRRFALDPACELAGDRLHPGLNISLEQLRGRLARRPLPVALCEDPEGRVQLRRRERWECELRRVFGKRVALVELPAGVCHRAGSGSMPERDAAARSSCEQLDRTAGGREPTAGGTEASHLPVLVISLRGTSGGEACRSRQMLRSSATLPMPQQAKDAAGGSFPEISAADRPCFIAPGPRDPHGDAFVLAVLTAATDEPRLVVRADQWARG